VNVFADPANLAVSPDGLRVYVGSAGSGFFGGPGLVTPLTRDRRTGVLSVASGRQRCFGPFRNCTPTRGITDSWVADVVVSPDGRSVYANSDGIAVFRR
jgi:DNA-binding beta-propeller fold protein YncE